MKEKEFNILQEKVDSINPPAGIGRIPRKIGSAFSSFTADEWKHWTILYSVHILFGVIPDENYECWCLFVDACRILCQLTITPDEVKKAHFCIINYCKRFQEVYGEEFCTPNMHMACHLQLNLLDYGPLAAFWAFSFERYNGILEGLQKSWRNPEKQMLLKFLNLQSVSGGELVINDNQDNLINFLKDSEILKSPSVTNFSSFDQTSLGSLPFIRQAVYYTCPVRSVDATGKDCYVLSQPRYEKCFKAEELNHLQLMYKSLYPDIDNIKLSHFYHESKQVLINGEQYLSLQSRSKRSPTIVAHWPNRNTGGIDNSGQLPLRVGTILSFFTHDVTFILADKANSTIHCLARVQWLQEHPRRNFFHPSIIVSSTLYDCLSPASFLPVSRIAGRCAMRTNFKYTFDYGEDNICLSIPLYKRLLT